MSDLTFALVLLLAVAVGLAIGSTIANMMWRRWHR